MALIECNECGKEISDKAENCIGCGTPISKQEPYKIASEPASRRAQYRFSSTSENKNLSIPYGIRLAKVTVIIAATAYVILDWLVVQLYPYEIITALYKNNMLIAPTYISWLLAALMAGIGFISIHIRKKMLIYVACLTFLILGYMSFQQFLFLNMMGVVWQYELNGPKIPQAPFVLSVVILQWTSAILLILPSSRRYFNR